MLEMKMRAKIKREVKFLGFGNIHGHVHKAGKNSYVSAVLAGWNFFSAHPGAWEIHYSIFSFHTQIPLLFSALFTLTPAWLNSEVEISGKRNTQSPSISFWQHRIIGKTFFLCLWYDQINVSNTNDGVVSLCVTHQWVGAMGFHSSVETIARACFFLHFSTTNRSISFGHFFAIWLFF